MVSLPDGQCMASRTTRSRILGSAVFSIRLQILPSGSQKRAKAQRFSASLSCSVGPSMVWACLAYGSLDAVSLSLNRVFFLVYSYNVLFSYWFQCDIYLYVFFF